MIIDFKEKYNFKGDVDNNDRLTWFKWKENIKYAAYELEVHNAAAFQQFESFSYLSVNLLPSFTFNNVNLNLNWTRRLAPKVFKMALFQELVRGRLKLYAYKEVNIYLSKFRRERTCFYYELQPNTTTNLFYGWLNQKVIDGISRHKGTIDIQGQLKSIINRMLGFHAQYPNPVYEIVLRNLKNIHKDTDDINFEVKRKPTSQKETYTLTVKEERLEKLDTELRQLEAAYKEVLKKSPLFQSYDYQLGKFLKKDLMLRGMMNT